MRGRPRLLVTGFGPFPGMARNPSEVIARRVAAGPRWRALGVDATSLVLPTTYAAIAEKLRPALEEPLAAILLVGVAARTRAVRIEQRALNRASILLPDASRLRPGRIALATGPAYRCSTVPAATMAAILRRHGVSCRASADAGRYLCNAAYFEALASGVPVLFLHIPKPPARRPAKQPRHRRRQSWEERLAQSFTVAAAELVRRGRVPGSRIRAPGL